MIPSVREWLARWALAVATAALWAGCIGPDLRDCSIVCAQGQGCPSGLTCGAEGLCRTSLDTPCSTPDPDDDDAGAHDDFDAAIFATESCNGADDDGDGLTDEGPGGELLACDGNCDATLFGDGAFVEEFDDAPGFPSRWGTGFVKPALSSGELVFGPYAATPNWWEKFGAAGTFQTFGEVLVCARIRIAPGAPRENSLDLFARGRDSTSILLSVSLSTTAAARIGYRDQIVTVLDQEAIPVVGGTAQSFTVILFAQADRFRAEVKNAAAEEIVRLDATSSTAAATGNVGMIGWDLFQSAALERVVAGPPSERAAAILAATAGRERVE